MKQTGITIFPTNTDATSGLETTNYGYYDCAGTSYAIGLGNHLNTCNPSCYQEKSFTPAPHFKMGMNVKFLAGDSCIYYKFNDDTFQLLLL